MVAAETALPVSVAEDDRFRIARQVVLGRERAPEHRLYTKNGKRAVRDQHGIDPLGFIETGDGDRRRVPHPGVFEGLAFISVGEIKRRRLVHQIVAESRGCVPDAHQTFVLLEGEWFQENSIDDTEDGGVGADSYGEGHHRDHREHGKPGELAKNVS